ncbi:MAG: hypothetical protein EXR98_15540 [Gemmataceae bacterium]|nr:hypothetical protein [Gemmataceae bacterium]
MKRKILAVGLFSLCCLALFTSDSSAFGLLAPYRPGSLWNKHNRYTTTITCRPYNAFTPICWGNLVCDGCNPSPCGVANGCLPMTMGVPPFACVGGNFGAMPYMGGASASDMHRMPPMHMAPNPQFNPPMPTGPNTTMHPYTGVAQANYPMYAPQYYPNYYMPTYYNPNMGWQNTQQMPTYWYGYGR